MSVTQMLMELANTNGVRPIALPSCNSAEPFVPLEQLATTANKVGSLLVLTEDGRMESNPVKILYIMSETLPPGGGQHCLVNTIEKDDSGNYNASSGYNTLQTELEDMHPAYYLTPKGELN